MTTTPPTLHSQAHLRALTGARFFAALVVVLTHLKDYMPYSWLLTPLGRHSQLGVCFFFILSGFILTYNYEAWFRGGVDRGLCRAFYRARFARVFPMHLFALLLITPLVLGHLALAPADLSIRMWSPLESWTVAGSWLANLLLVQAWLPIPAMSALWNMPAWSISAEAFFYLIFPFFTATVLARLPRRRQLGALALGLFALEAAACVAAALAVRQLEAGGLPHELAEFTLILTSCLPPVRVGEFLLGCVLGTVFLREREAPHKWLAPLWRTPTRNVLLASALLATAGLSVLPFTGGFAGYLLWLLGQYVLFIPAFALVIACLAAGPTFLTRLLEHPRIVLLGEASYALYLLHWIPVVLLWQQWVPRTTTMGVTLAVATILASIAALKSIEMPARRRLRGEPPVQVQPKAA